MIDEAWGLRTLNEKLSDQKRSAILDPRAFLALQGGSELKTDSVWQNICVSKMGQKKGKSESWTLRLFVIHLKKRGVPLRIYEMVRWEDTLLGLVRKKKVCIHHLIFEVQQSWVQSPNSFYISPTASLVCSMLFFCKHLSLVVNK